VIINSVIGQELEDSLCIVNAAKQGTRILIGDAGIPKGLKEQGYVATLIATLYGRTESHSYVEASQSIHVTRKQLEDLSESISDHLRFLASKLAG
jgi:hypothetical protein